MKGWHTDMVAIGAGALALLLLLYGVSGAYLVMRLAYPSYDADVVGPDGR